MAGIAATYMSYSVGKEIITEEVYAHLETTTNSRANHIKTFLREHGQYIQVFAKDIVFRELLIVDKSSSDYSEKFERANKQIKSIAAISYEINEIFVLDSDGKIVATSHTLEAVLSPRL